jgi:M6 family metalloprotease-like protein
MNTLIAWLRVQTLIVLSAAGLWLVFPALGQTLQDFGHGALATGSSRPMLVVLADFATGQPFGHDPAYYDDFVFNAQRRPSVNGYFKEVSNGRFTWQRAGVIGPIPFTFGEMGTNFTPVSMDFNLRRLLYHSNMVHRIMASGLFNFAAADANRDGRVTQDELVIVVISNDPWENSSWRWSGPVKPAGSPVELFSWIVRLGPRSDFATMCHEITHSLGAYDLYGGSCLSSKLTLMSCTGSFEEDPAIYHLDPWHKMVFGWSDPRLRSLRTGGAENIPAAQFGRADAPLLLFDSSMGSTDFFLIEYRAPDPPGGAGYDANVSGTGMVVWHVSTGQIVATEGSPALERGGSTPWPSAALTPPLRWANGTTTGTRIRSFDQPDGTITVEWLTELETWVDFAYRATELGTFLFPFNTFFEGQNAVPLGGTLWIKTGTSSETASITKPMTLRAYNGPVSIGRLP